MKVVNLWELNDITDIKYTNDINEFLELIKYGEIRDFKIRDFYDASKPANSTFESIFHKEGVSFNYVSDEYPILISNNNLLPNVVSPKFYKEHEKEIKEAFCYYFDHKSADYLLIHSYEYSSELIDVIIKKNIEWVDFQDVEVSQEDIKKLRDNYISASLIKNGESIQLSTNKVIGNYTFKRLDEERKLLFTLNDLLESNLDNCKYIKDNVDIEILGKDLDVDEEHYYKAVKIFLNHLSRVGKRFDVKIYVINRSIFKKVFNEERFNNLNIFINNDLHDYRYEEYLEEDKKLDELVEPIKNANLSPLEKYLAVYNLVKNFKPYKENPNQIEESRFLRYILDNEYMVCVGYAKLLEVLCEKVGIMTTDLSIGVDISYDNNESMGEIPVAYGGHARCMVSIDDDKYDVHGLYISDPTWDNKLTENRLNYALMTASKITTGNRMLFYDKNEPILDINTFEDFNNEVNYLLKEFYKEVKGSKSYAIYDYATFEEQIRMQQDKMFEEEMTNKVLLLEAYKKVVKAILKPISCDNRAIDFYMRTEKCKNEEDFVNLLTDMGNYLLTRINQPISYETIIQASVNGSTILKGLNEQQREEEYQKTRKELYDREEKQFPYLVDEANKLGWKSR